MLEVAMVRIGTWLPAVAVVLMSASDSGCFSPQAAAPLLARVPASRSVTGMASWYGPGFNGHRTSSGAIYNQDDLSAASTLFPLGSRLLVTNLTNGRAVEVQVNDHGPYVSGRDLDLSRRAALLLGMV